MSSRVLPVLVVVSVLLVQMNGCANDGQRSANTDTSTTLSSALETTTTTLTAMENDPTDRIVVSLVLNEFTIEPDKNEVPAGEIVFSVLNKGKLVHEVVALRSDHTPSKLPIENSEAVETGPGISHEGEIEDIQPGGSGKLVLMLKPGYYHLICNIPGHYKQGMYTDLVVK